MNVNKSIFLNSLPYVKPKKEDLWQHFGGIEIETDKKVFDTEIMNLMDFDCEQKTVFIFSIHCLILKKEH